MKHFIFSLLFLAIVSYHCLSATSTSSANAAGSVSAGTTTASAAGSAKLSVPVAGLVNLPVSYIGCVAQSATGLIGSLLPGLSVVANAGVGNVLNLASSVNLANTFAQNGATVSLNISVPACGLLSAVANTGALSPVISLLSDLNNALSGISADLDADLSLGSHLGIYCQAAPSCTVSLSAIAINGIKVSEDLNVNGNSISNTLSVLINNVALGTCNFQVSAQLAVNCGVGALVDNISQCRFLFELLGAAGSVLGSVL